MTAPAVASVPVSVVPRSPCGAGTLHTVRAKLHVMVGRILKKYGYPPDLCEEATRTVLEQEEL